MLVQPSQLYCVIVGAFSTKGIPRSRPALAVLAGGGKRASPIFTSFSGLHITVNHFLDVSWNLGRLLSSRAVELNLATPDVAVNDQQKALVGVGGERLGGMTRTTTRKGMTTVLDVWRAERWSLHLE